MNKINDEETQATKLEELFAEVTKIDQEDIKASNNIKDIDRPPDIDVLNLPPRSEIHKSASKKIKLSIQRPFIRLLIVTLLLISIIIGIYYYSDDETFVLHTIKFLLSFYH